MSDVFIASVYNEVGAEEFLYRLLEIRLGEPGINISHRKMPVMEEHVRFVASHPYEAWYLIKSKGINVGAVYLSKRDEIGIYVLKEHRNAGLATRAIQLLMFDHPRPRYFANINPDNEVSVAFFRGLGFHLIQHTYELKGRT